MGMKLWNLIGGRKFLALLLSFVGLLVGKIASSDWVLIVAIFCGANALIDIFKGKKENSKP